MSATKTLGLPIKDIDLEVFGMSYDAIATDLRRAGFRLDLVGRQFAVIKVNQQIDVSIPRTERKQGSGHRGFVIEPDPDLDFATAALRRDFTINAMAEDFAGRLYDPHGGMRDLKQGVLRAVGPGFGEDPLRVLRALQFAARFNLSLDPATALQCQALVTEFPTLPLERIWSEWEKWAALGEFPSRGLRVLLETGWLKCFPEVEQLIDLPQDPVWHPEGDVFNHTLHVCDAASVIAKREQLDRNQRVTLLFAALAHDFGKAVTTVRNPEGRWSSPRHDREGVPLAAAFLQRIGAPQKLIQLVLPMVAEHMAHISLEGMELTDRVVRRLSNRLQPATLRQLSQLVEADHSGRPPLPGGRPMERWLEAAQRMALSDQSPQPVLQGRHLLQLGFKPGPAMGRLLKSAFEAQLDGAFEHLDDAIRWVQSNPGHTEQDEA
ncbi:MAG: HD domain-containing protein [Verrucomicrobia bacterium]|nr:HD domain-containing protein [Verrucomicrobiota bacterium]